MLKYCIIILFSFSWELLAQNSPAQTTCVPAVTITENRNNICVGTTVTFHATANNDGTSGVYQWKKNNVQVNNNLNYTTSDLHDDDVVVCEYSCKTICGIDTTVISNSITVHIFNDIAPVVTIANNDPLICEGELTVFTATASYGNAVPSYQWLVNENPVGTDNPVFSTSTITNGARVKCVLTVSTPSCPGTSRSATSEMAIYVYPMIHPAIAITPSKTAICRGEEIRFTATANGGAYPRFAWKINGVLTGDDASVLITSTLKDGDKVSCTITIDQDSRCHTSTSAPSNEVAISVRDFTDPTVTIAAPILAVCAGTPVTFTATPQNAGDYASYHWWVNGRGTGNNSPTFIYDQLADGDHVSCALTTDIPGCPITASALSDTEMVTVRSLPVITFSPPAITVMSGESAQLHASVTGNTASFTWQPAAALLTPQSLTSMTIPLARDTVFNLTAVDSNGCRASNALSVKVLHQLHMPSVFTPNTDGKNDLFRIPPGASINLQNFSVFDRWGNIVFKTTDIAKGWNGTFHGQNLATGTFVYLIKGIVEDKEVTIKGTVTLLR